MGQERVELTYEDIGHWREEEALRDDPSDVMSTPPGTRRRTTIMRPSPIDGGPNYGDGRQTGWYVVYDVVTGEHKLISIESTGELADLPQDALPAGEYANLLAQENESLAAHLFSFLREDATTHTAHHTRGSDLGKRAKLIFAREQLSYIDYQDREIGEGVVVPPIRSRAKDPASIVGPDNVEW